MLINDGLQLMRTGAQAVDIKRDKFHSRCQCKVNSARMVSESARKGLVIPLLIFLYFYKCF
jgi:hypothetical protein